MKIDRSIVGVVLRWKSKVIHRFSKSNIPRRAFNINVNAEGITIFLSIITIELS